MDICLIFVIMVFTLFSLSQIRDFTLQPRCKVLSQFNYLIFSFSYTTKLVSVLLIEYLVLWVKVIENRLPLSSFKRKELFLTTDL